MSAASPLDAGAVAAANANAPGILPASGRLAIIDGLRGIAAMLVVLFHFCAVAHLADVPVLGWLFAHGNFGVEVFFVISGFVIAYSVRNAQHTLPFLGRFALRRSVRLDPPYWLTIAAEIVLLNVGLLVFPDHKMPIPSAQDVLWHLVYLQGLLQRTQILPIFWTLCYEVQFYLVLVGTLVVVRAVTSRWPTLNKRAILIALAAISFTYSIAVDADVFGQPIHGLFIDRWYQFCLGTITLAVVSRWLPAYAAVLAWSIIAALLLLGPATLYTAQSALTCVATSMLIVLSMRLHWITRIAETRVLQFLGRISYSLYLIHGVVGWRFVSVALRLLPPDPSMAVRGLLFLSGVAISVGAAYLMYLLIEKPSLQLAGRIRTTTHAH